MSLPPASTLLATSLGRRLLDDACRLGLRAVEHFGETFDVVDYSEHAIGRGADAQAVATSCEMESPDARSLLLRSAMSCSPINS